MPHVNFTLRQFNTNRPTAALAARVLFVPSGPGMASGTSGSALYMSRPIVATQTEDLDYSVFLAPTTIITPEVWYTIRIEWLDSAGNFISADYPSWKVRVPVGDEFNLIDILDDIPLAGGDIWVTSSPTDPAGAKPGDYIINPITGDLELLS